MVPWQGWSDPERTQRTPQAVRRENAKPRKPEAERR